MTNPLITKCKVATRNPGPIVVNNTGCKSRPLSVILQGLLQDKSQVQDSVLGPEILRISYSRHKKDDLNICWPGPWAATRNGVRPGLVSGKVKMGL